MAGVALGNRGKFNHQFRTSALHTGRIDPRWHDLRASAELLVLVSQGPVVQEFDMAKHEFSVTAGNPAKGNEPLMGPVLETDGIADALEWSLRRFPDAYTGDVTLAAVFQSDDLTASQRMIGTASSINGGYHIETLDMAEFVFTKGGVINIDGGLRLTEDVSYAGAISYRERDGLVNFITRRLDTDVVEVATATDGSDTDPGDGVVNFGGSAFAPTATFRGELAMGAILNTYLPMAALREWANEPWGLFQTTDHFPAVMGEGGGPAPSGGGLPEYGQPRALIGQPPVYGATIVRS